MRTALLVTFMVAGVFAAEGTLKNRLGQMGTRNLAQAQQADTGAVAIVAAAPCFAAAQ